MITRIQTYNTDVSCFPTTDGIDRLILAQGQYRGTTQLGSNSVAVHKEIGDIDAERRLYSVSLDSRLGVGSRDVAEEGDGICKNLTLKTSGLSKQVRVSIERAMDINTH